ncbi:uncharacterized protein LOC125801467 isoform X1 [Astyanax mexicanus]|uniref:uncharacterized protein LOC125801467 isoform X1 n=1 Tax=Astyanax mexicanus TaxID=7994 RepID=UPI0020CB4D4E|nr:uncharacterized protein LOC125801467 isoform X1 [Astyanax mexicanus]XP_049334196.1 uncharacterized protein LOC125801467 isoform X1 [Astyanax mexicanus]
MENNCMTIGFSKCVSIINFFSHFMCRHIAGQIDPRPWTEKTGRSFDHFPQQTSGHNCGILILIYALCICTNTPFIFTENDVPLIRQWWCILLMERFQIEGHGQRFAFWTDKASRLLQGTLRPLFRVSRSITSDIPPHVQTMVNRTAQEKKLVDFAVQDHGVRQHLLGVLCGKEPSKWLSRIQKGSSLRVPVYLDSEEEQDSLFFYLQDVLKSAPVEFHIEDQVQFILDVLFPECITQAMSTLQGITIQEAEELFLSGPNYSRR